MHWGTRFLFGFLVSYIKLTLTQQNTRGCSVWGGLGGISALRFHYNAHFVIEVFAIPDYISRTLIGNSDGGVIIQLAKEAHRVLFAGGGLKRIGEDVL